MGIKEFFNNILNGSNKAVSPTLKPNAQAYPVNGYEAAAYYSKDRSYLYSDTGLNVAWQDNGSRLKLARDARFLLDNFPPLERIVSLAETYAVGSGIVANAATVDDVFNSENTALFDSWADNQFCSNNQRYNLYGIQKLIVRELLTVGEVFLVLVKSPVTNYPQLMLVRSEDVRTSNEQGDDSIDGLYVDAFGKVDAYNIFTDPTTNVFQKVDAENVVHLMLHKKVGQLRGITPFASSLLAIRDYKDINTAEKKAIKIHSSLAAVVTRASGNATTDPVFGNIVGDNTYSAPLVSNGGTSHVGLERAFLGAVAYTEQGEKIELLAGERSTQGFLAFQELMLREVCLSISLPYEFVINPDKLNGTAMRFVIADAAAFFNGLQNILIDGLLNRVYGWVTASNIKAGNIDIAPNILPYPVSWTKPISITVDQGKADASAIAMLQNSLITYESYYSARGKNWQQELTQKAKEEAFLNKLATTYNVDINRLRTLQQGAPSIQAIEEQDGAPEQKAA